MKLKWANRMRRLGIIGLLWLGLPLSASAVDEKGLKPEPLVVMPKPAPVGELFRYQFTTGSNVLPFSMTEKLALGGYVGSDITQEVESHLKGNNRAGLYQQFSLVIYPLRSRFDGGALRSSSVPQSNVSPKKVALNAISVRSVQSVGAKFSDDAYRLVFRGNGYYRGQTLDVGNNQFQVLGYNAVDFRFDAKVKFQVSLLQATSFSRLQTGNMSLFTSASGDSLAFNGRFYSQGVNGNPWLQKGLGLAVGFDKMLKIKGLGTFKHAGRTHYLYLGVKDFGFIHMPKVAVQSRGYVWDASMQGLSVAGESSTKMVGLKQAVVNAKELQLSNWFGNQRDSAISRLQIQEQTRSGTVLTPFALYADLTNFKVKGQYFSMNVTYLNVPGYRVSGRLSWEKTWMPKGEQKWTYLTLSPYLAMGGFDTYDLGCAVNFETPIQHLGKTFFRVDIRGLEAWVMPNKQHGAGLSAAMIFKL
ncbi:MAG: hypothetical protein FJ333_06065 [Sphingomonadales bacterium]|nr:hypothetical protein [Sphingomonadales bacterium]